MTLFIKKTTLSDADYLSEAKLEPEFAFDKPLTPRALQPEQVFLTGVTGLVGIHLLDELLRKTSTRVYCLVRADSDEQARKRLNARLQAEQLWRDAFFDRIVALPGDVSLPRFGLTPQHYAQLAHETDAIYHCAGIINMSYTYAQLKPCNVVGVKQALQLAGEVQTKSLHFVSSIAVFYNEELSPDRVLLESDEPHYHASLKGDYGKSKWVADRLVAAAQVRGLPACIYRPTRIMGHSQTGMLGDTTEILPALIRGCLHLGKYPDWDIEVTWVPVDYVSRSMVHIAKHAGAWGKAFHFFNRSPILWRKLMDVFIGMGYALQPIPYTQWKKEIRLRASREYGYSLAEQKFYAGLVLAFLGFNYLFLRRPPFDDLQTLACLEGSGIHCPPIDSHLIKTYTNYWQRSGFLLQPDEITQPHTF